VIVGEASRRILVLRGREGYPTQPQSSLHDAKQISPQIRQVAEICVAVLPETGGRCNLDGLIVRMAAREGRTLIKFEAAAAAEGKERQAMKPARVQPRGSSQRRRNGYFASGGCSPIACCILRNRIISVRFICNASIVARPAGDNPMITVASSFQAKGM
jgi:hypothetical protein